MTAFKETPIIHYTTRKKTGGAKNWGIWEQPVTIQEYGAINRISISPVEPNYFAITSSSKVLIYNPVIKDVFKTLSKFKDNPYSGKFRRDGKLLCVGTTEGQVKVFDISTKTMLRVFRGHSAAVRQCEFTADNVHIASFSDDKTVGVWDLATETRLDTFSGHKEYVRCGVTANANSDLLLSGSYDETVALWDRRTKEEPVLKVNHGAPVQDVLILNGDSMFVTAGGNMVKIWDITNGGKMLRSLSPHHKLVTSMCLADNGQSLVTGSLDRQVKRISLSNFKITGALAFPSSVLSVDVDLGNKYVVAGMTDGLVQIIERKKDTQITEEGPEGGRRRKSRFMEGAFVPSDGDVLVQDRNKWMLKHDYLFRRYEYTEALNYSLVKNVVSRNPAICVSVMYELIRRRGLEVALAERTDESLIQLLDFIESNITDLRFQQVLVYVASKVIDMYMGKPNNSNVINRKFLRFESKLERMLKFSEELTKLQGCIDLVVATAGMGTQSNRVEKSLLKKV